MHHAVGDPITVLRSDPVLGIVQHAIRSVPVVVLPGMHRVEAIGCLLVSTACAEPAASAARPHPPTAAAVAIGIATTGGGGMPAGYACSSLPRSQGPAARMPRGADTGAMQRQYCPAAVVAEAASGLRLNISNDGWHAVDFWETTACVNVVSLAV
jgi:hypothetical protein